MFKIINSKNILLLSVILILLTNIASFSSISTNGKRPDLIIQSVDIKYENSDEDIKEGDIVEFEVQIKNTVDPETGEFKDISSGIEIIIALYIDNKEVARKSSDIGLEAGDSLYIDLTWGAEWDNKNTYVADIIVDPSPSVINERDEDNNRWSKILSIKEKNSDIQITNIILPDKILINQSSEINVEVTNTGMSTDGSIITFLNSSKEGEIQNLTTEKTLERDETHDFVFTWIPQHFGSQQLNIDIIYDDVLHDRYLKTVFVGPVEWWNDSWHYRDFLTITGSGVFSKVFNFTQMLDELGVSPLSFENDTLRVVRYNKDGEVQNLVEEYLFNESSNYNASSNAIGELFWSIPDGSDEKYYVVYFDVKVNPGNRTSLDETSDMVESGDASLVDSNVVEGWWIDVLSPVNGSFTLIDDPVDFSVVTSSKAENVTAFLYNTSNLSKSPIHIINLTDIGDNIIWSDESFYFDQEGNWTIEIISNDKAGYSPSSSKIAFFVGKPDFQIYNITFAVDSTTNGKIYVNDQVNITAHVNGYNATVDDVNVSMFIYNDSDELVITKTVKTLITRVEENLVSFQWNANITGNFEVKIAVDPENKINETSETNNNLTRTLIIYDWPDLDIIDIILPSNNITEFEKVEIKVTVANLREWDADNYQLILFIEKNSMTYSDQVYNKYFSIKGNSQKTISMFWNSSKPGEWLVGAKIKTNDTKKDNNSSNNHELCEEYLIVQPVERNRPVIKDLEIAPSYPEQGEKITIWADITDETGIKSVEIEITDPIKDNISSFMISVEDDQYKYYYDETLEIGEYNFDITAWDSTPYMNKATYTGSFTVFEDTTDPVIHSFGVDPFVQLVNETIRFSCFCTDNTDIEQAIVIITLPDGLTLSKSMTHANNGNYVYEDKYDMLGRNAYYIRVEDKAGNTAISSDDYYWIANDLNDTDNDGMPDQWENKYGFNPYNSSDADEDFDGDGITNLQEYKNGMNPRKDIFIQTMSFRIRENIWYVLASIILFFLLISVSIVGRRQMI